MSGSLPRFNLGLPLPELKTAAHARIDEAAELARLRFLTAGAGQAAEYLSGEQEARAILALPALANLVADRYPFVVAEQAAQVDAGGPLRTLREIAAEIVAQADAWRTVGSAIKRIRRGAKLRIDAASSPQQVMAAAKVTWPSL